MFFKLPELSKLLGPIDEEFHVTIFDLRKFKFAIEIELTNQPTNQPTNQLTN